MNMKASKEVSLNMNVRGLGQSATLAVNAKSKALLAEGKTVYKLGLGQSPFPVPDCVEQALKDNAHKNDYLPALGLPALRKAVAEWHSKQEGLDFKPEHVLIGPGSKELMFNLQLVYYGELMVPTPCWVSYVPQARIIGRPISLIRTPFVDRWHVNPTALEEHCASEDDDYRPRLLVLNYPGNPEGCTYSSEQLQRIAEVARAYRLVVLSDEIYGPLHHKNEHVSIARYYPEGTIISNGLSKWCGAGGWRLGTFTFPPDLDWLLEKMGVVGSQTFSSVCAPIQYAAVAAYEGGAEIEDYLAHARRILGALGMRCSEMLNEAGVLLHDPTGGIYLFPDFDPFREKLAARGIVNGAMLCDKLLEDTGVAMLPGRAFGRPTRELTARIAYVDFDGAKALDLSREIGLDQPLSEDYLSEACGNILEAIGLICDWLKG